MPASTVSSTPPSPTTGRPDADAKVQAAREGTGQVAWWRSAVLLVLTGVMVALYAVDPPLTVRPVAGVEMNLPVIVGDFFGKAGSMNPAERGILPADTELVRRYYADTHGHEIECSIVLSGAEQRSIHRPEGCMTSQGWTILQQDSIPIPLASGHPMMARRLILGRNDMAFGGQRVPLRSMFVYWFVGEHTTTASEMHRVLLSNWDRVIHGVAHRWAYVSMFTYITDNLQPNGLNAEQTQEMITDFARQSVPKFQIDEMPAPGSN